MPGKSKFPIKYYVNSNAKQQENTPDTGDHRFECCEDQGPPGVLLQCTFPGSSKFPIKYYANSNTKQQENTPDAGDHRFEFCNDQGPPEVLLLAS